MRCWAASCIVRRSVFIWAEHMAGEIVHECRRNMAGEIVPCCRAKPVPHQAVAPFASPPLRTKSQPGNGDFVSQLLKYQSVCGNKRVAMSVLWACEAKSKIRRRNPVRGRRLSVQTRTHRQSLNMSTRHREMCARRRHQIQTAIKSPDGRPANREAVFEAATKLTKDRLSIDFNVVRTPGIEPG